MTQPKSKYRYPSAFYAAAGVGDLVYEQLRRLQTKAIAFGSEQAPQWKRRVADLSVKVDAAKVRETVVIGTQAAAEKATKVYGTLVARGEKAVSDEAPLDATPVATKAVSDEAAPKATPVVKKAAGPRKKAA